MLRICKGAGTGGFVPSIGSEVEGVVGIKTVTCGELEACTEETAVPCLQEALDEGWKGIPFRRRGGNVCMGATSRGDHSVVPPRLISLILSRDKGGLR